MKRKRIINTAADSSLFQVIHERVAERGLDREDMKNMFRVRLNKRCRYKCILNQRLVVALSDFSPPFVLFIERAQFDAKNGGLKRIEPAVHALDGVKISFGPAVIGQLRYFF